MSKIVELDAKHTPHIASAKLIQGKGYVPKRASIEVFGIDENGKRHKLKKIFGESGVPIEKQIQNAKEECKKYIGKEVDAK